MLTTLVPVTVLLIAVALVGVFGFTRLTQTLIQVASLASVPIYDLRGQFSGCVLGVRELQGDRLGFPVAHVRVGESGFALRDTG